MGAMRRATRLSARSLMYEGAIWSGWSGAACAPVCGCAHSVLVAGAPGLGGDGARFMSSYPNMMKRKKQRESKLESIDDIVKGLYKFYPGNEEEGEVDPTKPNAWVNDKRFTRQQLAADYDGRPSATESQYPLKLGYFYALPDLKSPRRLHESRIESDLLRFFPVDRDRFPAGVSKEVIAEFDLHKQDRVMLREDIALLFRFMRNAAATTPESKAENAGEENRGMFRKSRWEAFQQIAKDGRKNLHLTGPSGVGKSAALVAAVQWASENNWITWYIPDAAQFTSGGRFAKHESGMWDTPMIASSALKWLLDANGDKLKDVPLRGKDHKDFGDLAGIDNRGVSSVDALIWARQELTRCKEHPVLVAVDNYSALYGPTGYGHWVDFKTRQALQPGQLRAVNAMRVLEHAGPARGVFMAASKAFGPISKYVMVPTPTAATFPVSPATWRECVHLLHYMLQNKSCRLMPKVDDMEYLCQLCNGNWKEIRDRLKIFPLSMYPGY